MKSEDRKKRLILIDGMAILHRAYHAYPMSLTTPTGELTNAVYGFTTILLTVIEKLLPTHVVVAWDVGKPTFRHEEYEGYKARREKPDEELINQIERTREVVEVLNIPQFGVEGYEADDVIGTLSKQAIAGLGEDREVIIVTGDRDALQLVEEEKIKVWMPAPPGKYGANRGPSMFGEDAVKHKYDLSPKQLIDLKALMGDNSDDIPGIKGVGEKTAVKLVKEFENLEGIYEAVKKEREKVVAVVGERFAKMLENGKESAYMSRKLGTIVRDIPIELDWDKCKLSNYEREKVVDLFEKLAFKSLVNKLPKDKWEEDLEEMFG